MNCNSTFCEIQKNPIKPKETGRFMLRGPRYRLRYAQHTKIHSNPLHRGLGSPKFLSVAGEEKAGLGTGFCGRGKRYGRLARSDEHSPGFPVSGSEAGHAVQVRERTHASSVQVGQPLALYEI